VGLQLVEAGNIRERKGSRVQEIICPNPEPPLSLMGTLYKI
jgi:hypothetical protein